MDDDCWAGERFLHRACCCTFHTPTALFRTNGTVSLRVSWPRAHAMPYMAPGLAGKAVRQPTLCHGLLEINQCPLLTGCTNHPLAGRSQDPGHDHSESTPQPSRQDSGSYSRQDSLCDQQSAGNSYAGGPGSRITRPRQRGAGLMTRHAIVPSGNFKTRIC